MHPAFEFRSDGHYLWQMKDGVAFFDMPSMEKWGLCPLPLDLGQLCDCRLIEHREMM